MTFKTSFRIEDKKVVAGNTVSFINTTTFGTMSIDDSTTFYDKDFNKLDSFVPNISARDFVISKVEKIIWDFGDGEIGTENSPNKVYRFPGSYDITVKSYSPSFYDIGQNQMFRVCSSYTTTIEIYSLIVDWLYKHMTKPHKDAFEENKGFRDLIEASSKMFDRMYSELTLAADLVNVENINPSFLGFLAENFGHSDKYSKKIGYHSQNDVPFLEYDIFKRISDKTANSEEISTFRNFIKISSKWLREKGTQKSISDLFKMYGMLVETKELWTKDFGSPKNIEYSDDFVFVDGVDDTNNKLTIKDIAVTGINNANFSVQVPGNKLFLDNYHYVTKHVNSISDRFEGTPCDTSFEINDIVPNVISINYENGQYLGNNTRNCGNFNPFSQCYSPTQFYGSELGYEIKPNEFYSGDASRKNGFLAKIFKTPNDYRKNIIDTGGAPIGSTISNPLESEESPSLIADDVIWTSWNSGISSYAGYSGATSSLTRPAYYGILNKESYSTTEESLNLFPELTFDTSNNIFCVFRGYLKVDKPGYYIINLDIGNVGGLDDYTNHHGLFSLKKNSPAQQKENISIADIDTFTFNRVSGTSTYTIPTTAGSLSASYRNTEYGLIEIRPNNTIVGSDNILLQEGYYPYEIKVAYGNSPIKKLNLTWRRREVVGSSFVTTLATQNIQLRNLVTFNNESPGIAETQGIGLLKISNDFISPGASFKVTYLKKNNDDNILSGVFSKNKVKDFIADFRISNSNLGDSVIEKNPSFSFIFRGINRKKDIYSDVDSFYSINYDGINSEYDISYCSSSSVFGDIYFKKLIINENTRENNVLFVDSSNKRTELKKDTPYDFRVVVKNNLVSLYYRENVDYSNLQKNKYSDVRNFTNTKEYIKIFENVNLIQDNKGLETFDRSGQKVQVNEEYDPISIEGHYGVLVKNSAIVLDKLLIKVIDLGEESLYSDVDKFKHIKPKWLNNRNNELMQYSIGNSDESSFVIDENYSGDTIYDLSNNLIEKNLNENSISKLAIDNLEISDFINRQNITINSDYIQKNYINEEDFLNRTRLKIGDYYEPYFNGARYSSSVSSSGTFIGYSPIIGDNWRVMPHTISTFNSGSVEYPSLLSRDSKNKRSLIYDSSLTGLENTLNIKFNGVWEEVCPNSKDEIWTYKNKNIKNEVFSPIYRKQVISGDLVKRVVGVRVVDSQIMEDLRCRYCDGATIWGLYNITYDTGRSKWPNDKKLSPTQPVGRIRYFVPIGKITEESYIFLPPASILDDPLDMYGVELLGVYAHKNIDVISKVSNDNSKFILNTVTKWEAKYNGVLKSNYFIDMYCDFSLKLEKNQTNSSCFDSVCEVETGYDMESKTKQIIENIKNRFFDIFEEKYNWWLGNVELWTSSKVIANYDTNNIYGGSSDSSGSAVLLVEGFTPSITGNVDFILDSSWCITTTSWDNQRKQIVFSNLELEYGEDEKRFTLDSEKIFKINENVRSYIPILNVNISNSSFFIRVLQQGQVPEISPIGVHNWFYGEDSYDNIDLYNEAFSKCVNFNYAFYRVQPENYEISSKLSIKTNVSVGARMRVSYIAGTDENNFEIYKDINIGITDGIQRFFDLPPILKNYYQWEKRVKSVFLDNFTLDPSSYYLRIEGSSVYLILNVSEEIKSIIKGSRLKANASKESNFLNITTEKYVVNNIDKKELNFLPLIDDGYRYIVGKRIPSQKIKTTSEDIPYNLTNYNNIPCISLKESFANIKDTAIAGSKKEGQVGLKGNGTDRDVIFLSDKESNSYSIKTKVLFDQSINNSASRKRFDIIANGEYSYNPCHKSYGLEKMYFVGIGAFNFDIAIGLRIYDNKTNTSKETFLASWGDYGIRNIKENVWYDFEVESEGSSIKVYINEEGNPRQLVLNYNINKKYENTQERYIKGEWETLQSIIIGLKELSITYPEKLSDVTGEKYTLEQFKEDVAKTIPSKGKKVGFRLFNKKTFVKEITHSIKKPYEYRYESPFDSESLDNFIQDIQSNYPACSECTQIKKYDVSILGHEYVHIEDWLFYRKNKNDIPEKYQNRIDSFKVINNKLLVIEKKDIENGAIGMHVWSEGIHTVTWNVKRGTDSYGIMRAYQLFNVIQNMKNLSVIRNGVNIATLTYNGIGEPQGHSEYKRLYLKDGDVLVCTIGPY